MYPLPYSQEIADLFVEKHPRGWAYIQQIFMMRPDSLGLIFAKDQKLWNEFKHVVKHYQDVLEHCNMDFTRFRRIGPVPPFLQKFWHYLQHADYLDETGPEDMLLFPCFTKQMFSDLQSKDAR